MRRTIIIIGREEAREGGLQVELLNGHMEVMALSKLQIITIVSFIFTLKVDSKGGGKNANAARAKATKSHPAPSN